MRAAYPQRPSLSSLPSELIALILSYLDPVSAAQLVQTGRRYRNEGQAMSHQMAADILMPAWRELYGPDLTAADITAMTRHYFLCLPGDIVDFSTSIPALRLAVRIRCAERNVMVPAPLKGFVLYFLNQLPRTERIAMPLAPLYVHPRLLLPGEHLANLSPAERTTAFTNPDLKEVWPDAWSDCVSLLVNNPQENTQHTLPQLPIKAEVSGILAHLANGTLQEQPAFVRLCDPLNEGLGANRTWSTLMACYPEEAAQLLHLASNRAGATDHQRNYLIKVVMNSWITDMEKRTLLGAVQFPHFLNHRPSVLGMLCRGFPFASPEQSIHAQLTCMPTPTVIAGLNPFEKAKQTHIFFSKYVEAYRKLGGSDFFVRAIVELLKKHSAPLSRGRAARYFNRSAFDPAFRQNNCATLLTLWCQACVVHPDRNNMATLLGLLVQMMPPAANAVALGHHIATFEQATRGVFTPKEYLYILLNHYPHIWESDFWNNWLPKLFANNTDELITFFCSLLDRSILITAGSSPILQISWERTVEVQFYFLKFVMHHDRNQPDTPMLSRYLAALKGKKNGPLLLSHLLNQQIQHIRKDDHADIIKFLNVCEQQELLGVILTYRNKKNKNPSYSITELLIILYETEPPDNRVLVESCIRLLANDSSLITSGGRARRSVLGDLINRYTIENQPNLEPALHFYRCVKRHSTAERVQEIWGSAKTHLIQSNTHAWTSFKTKVAEQAGAAAAAPPAAPRNAQALFGPGNPPLDEEEPPAQRFRAGP